MVLTIVVAVLFAAIVFFHYVQGFFSATISAILAVLSAVLAFSLHEWVVESFLQGKAANTAHAMVLAALFGVFYLVLRILFDKMIPEGVSLPAAVDRVGGAVMGCIAATFALGILTIAAQELPYSASVAGYTKYDTADRSAGVMLPGGYQMHQGYDNSELVSDSAGAFNESDRKRLFPVIIPGVDDIVVDTVAHLSAGGSLAGGQPLTDIHPDFLQELFGQRAGIQAGAKHVQFGLPNDSDPAVSVKSVFIFGDPEVIVVDGGPPGIRSVMVQSPLLKKETKDVPNGVGPDGKPINRTFTYMAAPPGKLLIVVRLEFGQHAKDDEDSNVRFSPGSVRMVAPKLDESGTVVPADYYPIGTLEKGPDHPVIYLDKPDDFLFVRIQMGTEFKPGVDLVYLVDEKTFESNGKIASGVFLEFKRLWRQELASKQLTTWAAPEVKEGEHFGTIHPARVEVKSGPQ